MIFTVRQRRGRGGLGGRGRRRHADGGGPIAITAARCDPHALIEYKRTFIFTAYVAVDDGEPARVDFRPRAAPAALEELLRSCMG